jgi:hypothetical protein
MWIGDGRCPMALPRPYPPAQLFGTAALHGRPPLVPGDPGTAHLVESVLADGHAFEPKVADTLLRALFSRAQPGSMWTLHVSADLDGDGSLRIEGTPVVLSPKPSVRKANYVSVFVLQCSPEIADVCVNCCALRAYSTRAARRRRYNRRANCPYNRRGELD